MIQITHFYFKFRRRSYFVYFIRIKEIKKAIFIETTTNEIEGLIPTQNYF